MSDVAQLNNMLVHVVVVRTRGLDQARSLGRRGLGQARGSDQARGLGQATTCDLLVTSSPTTVHCVVGYSRSASRLASFSSTS
jgi:hypothetical protein